MKRILLSLFLLTCFANFNAQVLFYEDFDGITGPTAGGAGTYSFPNGWFLRNVDNRTPAATVSYVNEAWERREDFSFNVADSAAFSTSWYSPVGAADDWMWTPLVVSIGANTVLSWNAIAYDPAFPDGYEVRIMTSSQGPPTGGAGVMGNQLTSSTQIFSIAAENNAWTARTVSLAAYAGQSIYVAFRNNSSDKFLLLIDDVKIETMINYDAAVNSVASLSRYSKIPFNQSPAFPLSATINNMGLQAVTNVTLNANVYNGANALVYTTSSAPLASLASGANAVFTTTSPFIPTTVDSFNVIYSVSIAEVDQNTANNAKMDSIDITDTVYARDIGPLVGQLGIGAGNGGNLGNQFVLTDTAMLSSVSIFFNSSFTTWKVGMDVFNYNNGKPTTLLYSSPASTITGPINGWYLFPLPANTVLLPDTYVVAAREIDSTLTVGQSVDKFTNGTEWVNWPTTPFGGWANIEAFGGGFAKSFMIRANLVDKCFGKIAAVASSTNSVVCIGSNDTLIASGGASYLWDGLAGSSTMIVSPASMQTYTLTSINPFACYDTATITINVNSLPVVTATAASNTLCAGDSTTLTGGGALSFVWTGGVTDGVFFTPASTQTYTVTGTDINGCMNTATATVTLNNLPLVTASSTAGDTICSSGSTSLNGGGAVSYAWDNGVTDGVSFTPAGTQTYIVTGTDANACNDTASITIVVDPCLGINLENVGTIISVFPNPNNGQFFVDLKETMLISVYNSLGEIFINAKYPQGRNTINITNLSSGIYFIKAVDHEKQQIIKIIKEK